MAGGRRRVWVDPRSRGADTVLLVTIQTSLGRSPLTRGRLGNAHVHGHFRGSIPAHAGQTEYRVLLGSRVKVDPRSRGADGVDYDQQLRDGGRSPLTRGRRARQVEARGPQGSIPAHAGQTQRWARRSRTQRVDPRSRGADSSASSTVRGGTGRSPLTRGRPRQRTSRDGGGRSIPAHAGQTTAAHADV